jgi:exosortase
MGWLVSKLQYFWNTRPDLQFGWVVLLLCGYLFFESWEKRPVSDWRWRWWGLTLAGLGAGLLFLVQIYQAAFGTNTASTAGLTLGVLLLVGANLGFAYGWRGIREFGMPFAFMMVAVPLPGAVHALLVNGLQARVATVDVEILNLVGVPAQQVGSLIHLPNGTVGIDEACSGIRSLQSTIMASVFMGYLGLRNIGLRVLLVVAGVGLAVLGNLIRSLYLCLTAYSKGLNAIANVHDAAGWSILAFTATGVIIIAWLFSRAEKAAKARSDVREAGESAGGPPAGSE